MIMSSPVLVFRLASTALRANAYMVRESSAAYGAAYGDDYGDGSVDADGSDCSNGANGGSDYGIPDAVTMHELLQSLLQQTARAWPVRSSTATASAGFPRARRHSL